MTLAMSGATQRGRRAWPPASSTRRRRSAARSAWRSSRPCRATRSDNLIDGGESTASALTSGYHLAFLIGAALVVAAIVVAVTVLQPEEQAEEQMAAEPAYERA